MYNKQVPELISCIDRCGRHVYDFKRMPLLCVKVSYIFEHSNKIAFQTFMSENNLHKERKGGGMVFNNHNTFVFFSSQLELGVDIGKNYKSDMAIDELSVTQGTCT